MNAGVHSGLSDEKHRQAMKEAVWLFFWCIFRQTKPNGLVLGGAEITYERIRRDTHHPLRSLQRWMRTLVERGYLEVTYLNYKRMRIRVLNPKKHRGKQIPLPIGSGLVIKPGEKLSAKTGESSLSKVADGATRNGGSKQSLIRSHISLTPAKDDCEFCLGTGFKAVPRTDGLPGTWAVRCDHKPARPELVKAATA